MTTMKVLVAVEDDYFANEIIHFMTAHQWTEDVAFKVMHAVEQPPIPLSPSYRELAEAYWDVGTHLVRDVSAKIKNAFPDSSVLDLVVEGDPKEEIIRAANVWGADLIVLGARGRHGSRRFPLGSVSLAVSVHAPCSVIIVRPSSLKAEENICSDETPRAVAANK